MGRREAAFLFGTRLDDSNISHHHALMRELRPSQLREVKLADTKSYVIVDTIADAADTPRVGPSSKVSTSSSTIRAV